MATLGSHLTEDPSTPVSSRPPPLPTQRSEKTRALGWWASQVVLVVKNMSANAGYIRDLGSIPGQEDALEEGTATHSSLAAWRIP